MTTRRQILLAAGGGVLLTGSAAFSTPARRARAAPSCGAGGAAVSGPGTTGRRTRGAWTGAAPSLDPMVIPKYVSVLPVPPAMPVVSRAGGIDRYLIALRQFRQQVLPAGFPATAV